KNGRRSDQGIAVDGEHRRTIRGNAAPDARRDLAAKEAEILQAPEGGDVVSQVGQSPGVDDSRCDSGDSAGASSVGAARWRSLCDLRSQRSLSPRYQSQQPSE